MPAAEVEITPEIVRRLLDDQCPDLSGLDLQPLAHGWDNVSLRLGERLVARFPRRALAANLIENEARWLPALSERLPLPVPAPVFVGRPGHGFPWRWSIVPWLRGRTVASAAGLDLLDLEGCADDLAEFLSALHVAAPDQAPENEFRGVPLEQRDAPTRERIAQLEDRIDTGRANAIWDSALRAPQFDGPPVWLHGDLHPANLLSREGRISGVIDFGDLTSGDPTTDLAVAWTMFPSAVRSRFFDVYGGVDEDTAIRAMGWALSLGTAYLAHSADNPTMAGVGVVTLARVLEEN